MALALANKSKPVNPEVISNTLADVELTETGVTDELQALMDQIPALKATH